MKKRQTLILLMLIALAVIVGYGWFTVSRPVAATPVAMSPTNHATVEVASGKEKRLRGDGLVGGVLWWP